ncbi:MAG: ADP-ribosylglycohydrolase [Syntrophus sp. PtaU1.Bin005]|jgi:ADP-ribosylglycohydrolase/catechol 2,3-dioxygenase-like lactoylglutathione lyase family enzyme|nr:MAG: ADP-ribosylglycohydrolase [Syntrophus sp. PtaU1.Bin005]
MADNNTIRLKISKGVGAMLGAAFGDALGWPNERVAKSNASKQTHGRLHDFKRWPRRSGGRFFPHEEIIEEGEYSDDTQLILCLSRSLQKGEAWWDHFTQVELPFWSVYERGGGGATKRAVESWLDGVAPWSPNREPQDVKRYYDAGGNGVAMRVLPHVLRLGEKEFPKIATNIFLDGIATHGHPRALLGALAYSFALWGAFRKDSKLAYGELVEELIKNVDLWSALPAAPGIPPEWRSQAEKSLQGYMKLWESAKAEVMEYLEVCRAELSKGALSLDDDVLKKLQCFNRTISGAGTVAAIASVYLASRHAADPINGVVNAAFAIGSDTDTIASMTGGLLGCINGSDWLSSVKQGIQDAAYIEKNAFRLVNGHIDDKPTHEVVKRSLLKNWIDNVVIAPDSSEVSLPDRRKARVSRGTDYFGRSGKFKVEFRRLTTEDGQIIYLNKISKGGFGQMANSPKQNSMSHQQPLSKSRGCGSKIPVASFERAIWFYRDCLGLTVKKQSSDVVVFDQGLVLVPLSYTNNVPQGIQLRAMLYIQATKIAERFKWVKGSNLQIVTALAPWGKSGMLFFRSLDPDGNVVEVFSADGQMT